jgi:hypothetical protein
MYGGIGDIWRDYGRRREIDGVNQQGVGVRREIVWLPEQPPASDRQTQADIDLMGLSGVR